MSDAYGHRWLSEPVEDLVSEVATMPSHQPHCDVLVVGSGYGGAVAAARLAGACPEGGGDPIKVWLLERGNEMLPGMFPANFAELPGHVRFSMQDGAAAHGRAEGLFDVRIGRDACALVGNGLGGGSLINAAVMERPDAMAFDTGTWPTGMDLTTLDSAYQQAEAMLDPSPMPGSVPKLDSLLAAGAVMGAQEKRKAKAAITFFPGSTPAGVPMAACLNCGDCVTGCNHRAKQSLDVNYLAHARQKGARLFCGATVHRLRPLAGAQGFVVEFHLTDPQKARRDRSAPYRVNARRVVLAAGTFGSTEILLRSAAEVGAATEVLGARFSTNGDLIAVASGQNDPARSCGFEGDAPATRGVGPTITGLLRHRPPGSTRPIVIQEFGIPAPLRRLLGEVVATTDALHGLVEPDLSKHHTTQVMDDPLAVSDEALERTPVYGMMGDDGASGRLQLLADADDAPPGDGRIGVEWSDKKALRDVFGAQLDALRRAHERPPLFTPARGGRVLPNPMWQPVPPLKVLEEFNGPPLTVHPLGGCPMGEDRSQGVVDRHGCVFRATGGPGDFVEGLAVLDGSIVPGALGINPALTIAALAEHAIPKLAERWQLELDTTASAAPPPRPQRRDVSQPQPPAPTRMDLVERMSGAIEIGGTRFDAKADIAFGAFDAASWRRLPRVAPLAATLRLVAGGGAAFEAQASGQASVLVREASFFGERLVRALQQVLQRLPAAFFGFAAPDAGELAKLAALASHLGAVRRIEYSLTVDSATPGSPLNVGDRLRLTKRLVFDDRGNPWRQLTEGELERLGATVEHLGRLELDLGFLADQARALLAVQSQQDQPNALGDLAELLLWVLRVVLRIHLVNFLPLDGEAKKAGPDDVDDPQHQEGKRLPGPLGDPAQVGFSASPLIGFPPKGDPSQPHQARLSRYRPLGQPVTRRPVLLIHGYGAGGSTFAHPSIGINLVQALLASGREVWVLDLRTSIGLGQRTAWHFDDVARGDIPPAIDHVRQVTGADRVDIVAHCIGAAMFSVAALGEPSLAAQKVGAVVLSQVGPLVHMSGFNRFRGHVASYLRKYLGTETFDVRGDGSLQSLLVDSLLATYPYPDDDGERERLETVPGFAATRHRADAIFGRTMQLANIADDTLRALDDIYGWVMVDALAQTIHYAREQLLTDENGLNRLVTSQNLAERFGFPLMMLHGRLNALFDPGGSEATVRLLAEIFDGLQPGDPTPVAGRRRLCLIGGYGHQDTLIGREAHQHVFPHIVAFLDEFDAAQPDPVPAPQELVAAAPVVGPAIGPVDWCKGDPGPSCRLSLGWSEARPAPIVAVLLPGWRRKGRWMWDDNQIAAARIDPGRGGPMTLDVLVAAELHSRYDGFLVLTVHPRLPIPDMKVRILDKPQGTRLFLKPAGAPDDEARAAVAAWLGRQHDGAIDSGCIELGPAWSSAAASGPAAEAALALASCQYPPGLFDRAVAERSYARLADRVAQMPIAERPQALFLVGDQVYVDDTAGLFVPTSGSDVHRAYRLNFELEARRRLTKAVPTFPLLDDHEVIDNWEPSPAGTAAPEFVSTALDAYRQYQHDLVKPGAMPPFDYERTVAGLPVFVLDARSERQPRTLRGMAGTANVEQALIHPDSDFAALRSWLQIKKALGCPLLVVTSVALFPFSRAALAGRGDRIGLDDWGGYPRSALALLRVLVEEQAERVVLLAGDRHLSSVSSLWLEGAQGPLEVVSVVSSGTHAPWPFANARPDDYWLAGPCTFGTAGAAVTGTIVTAAARGGNGFGLLRLRQDAGGAWELAVELDLEAGSTTHRRRLGDTVNRHWT